MVFKVKTLCCKETARHSLPQRALSSFVSLLL